MKLIEFFLSVYRTSHPQTSISNHVSDSPVSGE